ncbi:TPA: ead/Ea22-like family protein [Serratia marcescens]
MKTTRNELKLRADKCPIKRFKAFIGKANTQATLCADTGIEIIGWSGFDASDLNAKSHRVELARFIAATDPETILALLAELEAKDKRIAELEGQLQSGFTPEALAQEERAENAEQRVAELEAKLATPVRLTDERTLWAGEDDYDTGHVKGWNANRIEQAALLKKQGLKVEGENCEI